MPAAKPRGKATVRKHRLAEAGEILTALKFGPRQINETAAYTLLALLDLHPDSPWSSVQAPLRGIKPITDSTRRNLQARRLDGGLWQGIGGKKAKSLPGVEASW